MRESLDLAMVGEAARMLETHLRRRFPEADGKGLGELTHSISDRLPEPARRRLLRIVGIRNALLHEAGTSLAHENLTRADFIRLVEQVETDLGLGSKISDKVSDIARVDAVAETRSEPAPARPERRPPPAPRSAWYRSFPVLALLFLFATPLWLILVLTDRRSGCLTRLASLSFTGIWLLVIAGLVGTLPIPTDLPSFSFTSLPTLPAFMPPALPTLSPGERPSVTAVPTQRSVTATGSAGCEIVWAAHAGELVDQTRAMVWEAIVADRVAGSGMTARDFYDEVVERNPVLRDDGYVFVQGETYTLPQCR